MAAFDDEAGFGAKPKPPVAHEIGQSLDTLSAPELSERIALLRAEIDQLEKAIEARQATPQPRIRFQDLSRSNLLSRVKKPLIYFVYELLSPTAV